LSLDKLFIRRPDKPQFSPQMPICEISKPFNPPRGSVRPIKVLSGGFSSFVRWRYHSDPYGSLEFPPYLRRLLAQKVKRDWHQPEAVVSARSFQDPPSPCPPMQGIVIRQPQIDDSTIYGSGQVPRVYTSNVRVCVCRLLTAWAGTLRIYDPSTDLIFYPGTLALDPTTTCVTVNLIAIGSSPSNENGVAFVTTIGLLSFGTGGGTSIEVNQ
jgi:hypothetical protein